MLISIFQLGAITVEFNDFPIGKDIDLRIFKDLITKQVVL